MKIAYITNKLGTISETFVSDLISELSKTVNIYVFCKQVIDSSKSDKVYYIKKREWLIKKILLIDEILKLLLKNDLCLYYKISAFLSKQALKKLKPNIVYIEFGLNAAEYLDSLNAIGIPFIVHFHGLDITSALSNTYYKKYLKKIIKSSSSIIVASYHIKRLLLLEGCEENKVNVIRYGISVGNTIQPIEWKNKNQEIYQLCFLGRLTPKKNPKALILTLKEIYKTISNVQLNIIGDGEEKADILEIIRKFNLENKVKLYGQVPKNKAMEILNNCHVYVQHSVTPVSGDQEGWALSISEASLLGIPVVATIHGGIKENVIDGKTGFLVPEYSYEEMAEKVIYLLQNPIIAEKMGKAGRERFMNTPDFKDSYRAKQIYKICKYHAITW